MMKSNTSPFILLFFKNCQFFIWSKNAWFFKHEKNFFGQKIDNYWRKIKWMGDMLDFIILYQKNAHWVFWSLKPVELIINFCGHFYFIYSITECTCFMLSQSSEVNWRTFSGIEFRFHKLNFANSQISELDM